MGTTPNSGGGGHEWKNVMEMLDVGSSIVYCMFYYIHMEQKNMSNRYVVYC